MVTTQNTEYMQFRINSLECDLAILFNIIEKNPELVASEIAELYFSMYFIDKDVIGSDTLIVSDNEIQIEND
jgi:hypothetical protein